MKNSVFRSTQFRVMALLIAFMTITFLASLYTISYTSRQAVIEEKENKLLSIAAYLGDRLGNRTYDDILRDADAHNADKDTQVAVLNSALAAITDDVASIYPGIGVGYYSLALDAIVTYGPSSEYSGTVGVAIVADHPGRTVMAENTPMVKMGTMVRGNIMNAMTPIERNGTVIGYTWANELTTDIEQEYNKFVGQIIVLLSIFFAAAIALGIYLVRRSTREIGKIVSGVKVMKGDLTKRIHNINGELSDVADSINSMAEHIEQTHKEHEALIVAEAANQAQRDFLARMSHEIRTPMNGVLGMTRMAMQADSREKSMEYMKKIQSSATILLGIINDILDFSKIEANKMELESHPFAIAEMVDNIQELVGARVAEKSLTLRVEVDKAMPDMAIGDSVKLSQVLLNLLGNAVKFTEQGTVGLTMSAAEADGRLRLDCAIQDTGIGMSEEQLALLFKPFSQVDSSMARRFGGTGLGLSISKALIELMGGEITVTSTANVGSTFSFYVLLTPCAGTSATHKEAEAAPVSYDGKTALLAEDIEINQEIALAVLGEFGLVIDVACNGVEAVEAFKRKDYDVVFMDIRMPVMDGLEATQQIRAWEREQSRAKRTPIIAMTANAMQEDREASSQAGMDGHISKPLDVKEISAELHEVLGQN